MSAFHTTKPLTLDRIARIQSLDPKMACGPSTTVSEVWRVSPTDGAPQDDHFVFIGDHGRKPYCSRCGFSCASVAAVENERVRKALAR